MSFDKNPEQNWDKSWKKTNFFSKSQCFQILSRFGTIHLRRWQIFTTFDPYPTTIGIPAKGDFWSLCTVTFDHRPMVTPLPPKTCWRLKWMVPVILTHFFTIRIKSEMRFSIKFEWKNMDGPFDNLDCENQSPKYMCCCCVACSIFIVFNKNAQMKLLFSNELSHCDTKFKIWWVFISKKGVVQGLSWQSVLFRLVLVNS